MQTLASFGRTIALNDSQEADLIISRHGKRDVIFCGRGRDTVIADRKDRLRGCERKRFGKRKRR